MPDNIENLVKKSTTEDLLPCLQAEICIRNHMIAAMGVGLVPFFLVELVGVTSIEVKMIRDLALIYNFPVPSKLISYKILISLIGTITPIYIAGKLQSVTKMIPLVGHTTYAAFLAVGNGAAVYAVGKIFQKHYESGGVFLGGSADSVKKYYEKKYEEGKRVVPTLIA